MACSNAVAGLDLEISTTACGGVEDRCALATVPGHAHQESSPFPPSSATVRPRLGVLGWSRAARGRSRAWIVLFQQAAGPATRWQVVRADVARGRAPLHDLGGAARPTRLVAGRRARIVFVMSDGERDASGSPTSTVGDARRLLDCVEARLARDPGLVAGRQADRLQAHHRGRRRLGIGALRDGGAVATREGPGRARPVEAFLHRRSPVLTRRPPGRLREGARTGRARDSDVDAVTASACASDRATRSARSQTHACSRRRPTRRPTANGSGTPPWPSRTARPLTFSRSVLAAAEPTRLAAWPTTAGSREGPHRCPTAAGCCSADCSKRLGEPGAARPSGSTAVASVSAFGDQVVFVRHPQTHDPRPDRRQPSAFASPGVKAAVSWKSRCHASAGHGLRPRARSRRRRSDPEPVILDHPGVHVLAFERTRGRAPGDRRASRRLLVEQLVQSPPDLTYWRARRDHA